MMWNSVAEYFRNHYVAEALRAAEYVNRRTGFSNLDGLDDMGRYDPDEQKLIFTPGIYVVGAPPSAGKSTFSLQWLIQLANRGEECLFLSYEMSVQALCRKLIAYRLFQKRQDGEPVNVLSGSDIRRAGGNDEGVNAVVEEFADTLNHLQILHVNWELKELVRKLRTYVEEHTRPPVIVLDYLQLVPIKIEGVATSKEKIDMLLSWLRKFQVDTGTTVILVSAFNRSSGMQSEATFSSFRESSSIEYTADCLLVLEPAIKDKESMSEADKRERQKSVRAMRLRCLKSREGALFEVYFKYYAAYDTFEPCSKDSLFDDSMSR